MIRKSLHVKSLSEELLRAIMDDRIEEVRHILGNCDIKAIDINVISDLKKDIISKYDVTFLDLAIYNKRFEIAELLINKGFKIKAGHILYAARAGNVKIIDFIVKFHKISHKDLRSFVSDTIKKNIAI